jgi:uncharacterized membrane protein YkvA (DUF1232 family)
MFGNRSRAARPSPAADDQTAPVADDQTVPVVVAGEVIEPRRSGRRTPEIDGRKVMVRFVGVLTRIPQYVKLGWLLMNDPTVSGVGKAALGGGLAYAISPIDPVPGFIPVLGQLDDLAVLLLAIRMALKSCPTEVADARLAEAGLSWEALERDLVTLRATTIWVATRSGALAIRAGKALLSKAAGRLRAALPGRAARDEQA